MRNSRFRPLVSGRQFDLVGTVIGLTSVRLQFGRYASRVGFAQIIARAPYRVPLAAAKFDIDKAQCRGGQPVPNDAWFCTGRPPTRSRKLSSIVSGSPSGAPPFPNVVTGTR